MEYRDEFMDELLRHEGLGGLSAPPNCEVCATQNALYQCLDCFHERMLCQSCIVETHQSNVLHGIKVVCVVSLFESANQRF